MANKMGGERMRGGADDPSRKQNRESESWSPNEPDRSQSQEPGSRSRIRDTGGAKDRDPAEGARDAGGSISNRPDNEERDSRQRVPPRGKDKERGGA